MRKISFSTAWVQKSSLLLAAMLAFSGAVLAQANFMTVFGNAGCYNTNRMTCAVTPSSSSFAAVSDPYDYFGLSFSSPAVDYYKNSVYDKSGHLLFSVNADGIYAPDAAGTYVFGFGTDVSSSAVTIPFTTSCGDVYSILPTAAISEIAIFQKSACAPNSYYVMFWCAISNTIGGSSIPAAILRCVEVDINPAFGTSAPAASWYSFTDNLINQPDCSGSNYFDADLYSFEIVADAPNTDGSRDIYTINPDEDIVPHHFSDIKKWTIAADGTLPTAIPPSLSTSNTLLPAYTTKAKMFTIGGDKVFAYVGSNSLYGYNLMTFDITNPYHPISQYIAPTAPAISGSSPEYQTIWGFEYLPSPKNVLCFAYDDESFFSGGTMVPTGGLGYATPLTTGGWEDITPISSTTNYCHSDLELDKNNDMLLVYDDLSGSDYIHLGNGSLRYIPASSLTSSFTSATPSALTGLCTGTPNISVNNNQLRSSTNTTSWYLGSQIRGDNSNWSTDLSTTYYVTTTETWSPTSNPVQAASGLTSVSTISANSIIIQPGGSLTISGMTIQMAPGSYVDVDNSPSSPSSPVGGRLVLNNSTLTVNPGGGCSSGGAMWGGVRVFGSAGNSQSPPGGSVNSHQGMITMNGSTISYAVTGVYLGTIIGPGANSGGIISATGSIFSNNHCGVLFLPYDNFNTISGGIMGNASLFTRCNFNSTDASTLTPSGSITDIFGFGTSGVRIMGCNFTDNIVPVHTSYGIYGSNMGFSVVSFSLFLVSSPFISTVIPTTFSNFTYGVYHLGSSPSYTPNISEAVFNNNGTGVYLSGSVAASVTNNTFNVPYIALPSSIHPGMYTAAQSIGIFLFGANQYLINSNTFNFSHGALVVWGATTDRTVGILADDTQYGSEDNLVNNNTYNEMGTANLSNYINTDAGINGLWYKCNTNKNNFNDIAAMGNNYPADGIRAYQGYPVGTSGYINGLPADNIFTTSSLTSVYNLYNDSANCLPFTYYYFPGAVLDIPGNPSVTAQDFPTYLSLSPILTTPDLSECILPGPGDVNGTKLNIGGITVRMGGKQPLPTSPNYNPADNYLITLNNINYYMNDSSGVQHRDSAYYWEQQLQSTTGELATAYMLLEDGYADSAYTLYHSIPAHDTLDSVQTAEFTQSGSKLFNVQSRIMSYYANIRKAVIGAYLDTLNADSVLLNDSALYASPPVDPSSQDSLISVFSASHYWAHIQAENLMFAWFPAAIQVLLTETPDTVLYPNPDSTQSVKWPSGVLAVTEISQGPLGSSGCEYAEMIVGNCGSDVSPFVDVSGWIIDDNDGNFDTGSCTSGITQGHYRLSPNSPVWQNIAAGSVIVVYNADVNCYNLPNSFTIDSAHGIFWVPVHATAPVGDTAVIQRYAGTENLSISSYCSDTGTTVYTAAYGWEQIIALADEDAIQVRCPGCTAAYPGTPAFYHGIGYSPYTCFVTIPADSFSIGGPVEDNDYIHVKYVFTGGSVADLGDPTMWAVSDADPAGLPPSTLGNVDSTLYALVTEHILGLPCCGNSHGVEGRKAIVTTKHTVPAINTPAPQSIKVYPVPATMMLYFQFPPSGDVTIRLMDLTGRVMDEQVVHDNTNAAFDVKGYPAAMYMYQVITNGQVQSGKFIIE